MIRKHRSLRSLEARLRRIAVVACDLDGTLLDNEGQVPESVRSAVHDLMGAGVRVVLASGRTDGFTRACGQRLATRLPIISLNGALVMDSERDVLSMTPVPEKTWSVLMPLLEKHPDLAASLFTPDGVISESADPSIPSYLHTSHTEIQHVSDAAFFVERCVAMCVSGPYNAIQACSVALSQKLGNRLDRLVYQSGSKTRYYLEIRRSGVSKGVALKKLLRTLDIPVGRSAAIGDYTNDLEMCTLVSVSAAMRNGIDLLKQRADFVTRATNADGGAAEFFRLILEHKR